MVKVWAEKEMRNYKRLHDAGIPTPKPELLKNHVLVMEFLGSSGWPSPRIRDARLSDRRMREAYVQCALILRHMFLRANLVHGDFSEYNALWHEGRVYVIDVSQSVESDHPSALDFLRKDISNVNDFFKKSGKLQVMSTRQLFEFVTSTVIGSTEAAESEALDRIMAEVDEADEAFRGMTGDDRQRAEHQADVDEAVFMSQFLPRSLNQVNEAELERMAQGEREEDYVKAVAMLTGNKEVVEKLGGEGGVHIRLGQKERAKLGDGGEAGAEGGGGGGAGDEDDNDDDDDNGDEEDGSSSEYDSSGSEDRPRFVKVPMTPEQLEERKAAKRKERAENKKLVKAEKKEKRKDKVKKKDKKRAIAKARAKKR